MYGFLLGGGVGGILPSCLVIVCKGLGIKFVLTPVKKSEVKSLYVFPSETLVIAGQHSYNSQSQSKKQKNLITV